MMRLALDPVDIPAVQAWLEDWAAKGWYLETYGRNLAKFAPGERRETVRYRLQPAERGGEPDQDTRDAYREMGWTYVCSTVAGRGISGVKTEFHIWRCETPPCRNWTRARPCGRRPMETSCAADGGISGWGRC